MGNRRVFIMRWFGILVVAIWLGAPHSAAARCGDVASDAAQIAVVRAQIAGTCSCETAPAPSTYAACANGVIGRAITVDGSLRAECRSAVRACVRRSTCGRPGAVTCCRPRRDGSVRCRIKRDAAKCPAVPPGTCVGNYTSCCDACANGGCVPSTTTTTTVPSTCSGGPFMCGGSCSAGQACAPIDDFPPYCGCIPDGSQPCGSVTTPFCNGTCPAGMVCGAEAVVPNQECSCIPMGATACGETSDPMCGGTTCPDGPDSVRVCAPFHIGTFDFCVCTDPDLMCSPAPPVGVGICPAGESCDTLSGMCTP